MFTLAEHLVATTFTGSRGPGALRNAAQTASSRQLENAIGLLTQASVDNPALSEYISEIIRANPVLAAEAAFAVAPRAENPGPLISALHEIASNTDLTTLVTIGHALPLQSIVLTQYAVYVSRQIVQGMRIVVDRDPETFLPHLAESLEVYSRRLSDSGQHTASLPPLKEAVDIRRRLADSMPDDLAWTLQYLSSRLRNVGEIDEAIVTARESVDRFRHISQRPRTGKRLRKIDAGLAGSLLALSSALLEKGEYRQALSPGQEALAYYRTKAEGASTGTELANVAVALNILATVYRMLGDGSRSLTYAQEAVEAYRLLVATEPDAYQHELAGLLGNLTRQLVDQGDRKKAFEIATEAVDHYSRVSQLERGAITSIAVRELEGQLNNIRNACFKAGDFQLAAAVQELLTNQYYSIADTDPSTYVPRLAESLRMQAGLLSVYAHDHQRAVTPASEAVKYYRALAKIDRDAFLPELASALNAYAIVLSELHEFDSAVAHARESVDVQRWIASSGDGEHVLTLVLLMTTLAAILSEASDEDAALSVTEEAVKIQRQLARTNPNTHLEGLAQQLVYLADRLGVTGRVEERLTVTIEVVDIFRRLHSLDGRYAKDLGASLNTLAIRLAELGNINEAVVSALEAVKHYRPLARQRPAEYGSDFVVILRNLSRRLLDVSRPQEAVTCAEESLAILRSLKPINPADLAESLDILADGYIQQDRYGEAATTLEQAMEVYAQLLENDQNVYLGHLARCLSHLSQCLARLGRQEEALAASHQAVVLFTRGFVNGTDVGLVNLASAQLVLVDRLHEAEQYDEAFKMIEAALRLYHGLPSDHFDVQTRDSLARALKKKRQLLAVAGNHERALETAREVVTQYRLLAEIDSHSYGAALGSALNTLAVELEHFGRRTELLTVAREAVDIRRSLANRDARYIGHLAESLNNLGLWLVGVDAAASLDAAREAAGHFRTLAEADPDDYASTYAMTLGVLADRLGDVGLLNEAVTETGRAVEQYRTLDAADRHARSQLAGCLHNLALYLSAAGQLGDARAAAEEAVQLFKELVKSTPDMYESHLAKSLENLSRLYARLGEDNRSAAAAEEAAKYGNRR